MLSQVVSKLVCFSLDPESAWHLVAVLLKPVTPISPPSVLFFNVDLLENWVMCLIDCPPTFLDSGSCFLLTFVSFYPVIPRNWIRFRLNFLDGNTS